ncbi:MAG TPA: MipA/OmpV family protein [Sphingomicrobium sp.]|jgi:outer membrane scaffolding protein for murein synthesis (MipA/OmpV family)
MFRLASFALFLSAVSAPVFAQEVDAPLPDPDSAGDNWTVAVGAALNPDYSGSDDYRIIPAASVRGKIGSVSISTKGTYLYADLFPRGKSIDIDAGPIVGVRLNRTGKIKDDVVDLLPDRNTAIEVGGFVGASLHNLTNPYDSLSFGLDVVHDIGNAHKSTVVSPNVSFSTPLSRKTYASASVGADFVSNKFADYYFSISPTDSLASGLPAFNAGGGMKSWKLGLLLNQSITGDLTGGLSVFGLVNYSRLVGDFKRSPIVSDRGSPNQWLLGAGLAYTF